MAFSAVKITQQLTVYATLCQKAICIHKKFGWTFEARIEKYFCFKVKLIPVDRSNSVNDRILLA